MQAIYDNGNGELMINWPNKHQPPAQSKYEFEHERELRARPWTVIEYERLRIAALAMVRTHTPIDFPGGRIRPSFDGEVYWAFLSALDRTGQEKQGADR